MSIQDALTNLFEDNRIVVWYNEDNEFIVVFNSLSIPNVDNKKVQNNDSYVKLQVLYERPKNSFLFHIPAERPKDEQILSADQPARELAL